MPCALTLRAIRHLYDGYGHSKAATCQGTNHSDTLRKVKTPQLSVKRALMSALPSLDVFNAILQKVRAWLPPACVPKPCRLQGVAGLHEVNGMFWATQISQLDIRHKKKECNVPTRLYQLQSIDLALGKQLTNSP